MKAKDPVCGMTVDVATAYAEAVEGDTYYFCSETCRQRFDENPAAYTAGGRAGEVSELERHEPPHTTKGGFTAPKFGAAGSGGAEYERVPEQHDENGRP